MSTILREAGYISAEEKWYKLFLQKNWIVLSVVFPAATESPAFATSASSREHSWRIWT